MKIESELCARIAKRLESHGVYAIVTADDGMVRLEGEADSAEMKRAATELVSDVDPSVKVDNQLDVMSFLSMTENAGESEIDQLTEALHELAPEAVEESREDEATPFREEESDRRDAGSARPYFPPTDPVVRVGRHGTEILGGFSATSVDELTEETSDQTELTPRTRGDEEIAADVLRELAEDAATTDLTIDVVVRNGTVRLRGVVASWEDADAAEEVAGRVPGVVDVDEKLEIQS
jgi:osmotically-inducible protein OsmY